MKLKPINAVFTAVLLIAPAAFAQESGQTQSGQTQQSTQTPPPEQQGQATQQQGQATQQQGQPAQQPGQTGAEQPGQAAQQPGQAGGGMAGGQQSGAQGAGAPTAAAPTGPITGTVTSYTPGQSITIRESNGQTREIPLAANSSVSPKIKTGSHVKVTESTVNGQQMVRVEPAGKHRAGAAGTSGAQALPRTASDAPLLGMFGLLSLAAAAGIRFANRKLA